MAKEAHVCHQNLVGYNGNPSLVEVLAYAGKHPLQNKQTRWFQQ